MKMKRLLALLLALAMCFSLAACKKTTKKKSSSKSKKDKTSQSADSKDNGQQSGSEEIAAEGPALYRVTDDDGHVVWLFGSIHLGREDYYPLPDYVLDAFNGADSLAVEVDIVAFEKSFSAQRKALSALVYKTGTIKDHIPQELYDQAVAILKENNSYQAALDYYCPAFWASNIDSFSMGDLASASQLSIDRHLINKANEVGKEILEIESAEFQYGMLAGFDDEVQAFLLTSSVESYENPVDVTADLNKLLDLWAAGDEEDFEAYLTAVDPTMTKAEKDAYARYRKAMITDRNVTMADYAEDALASGKEVFICVGAAHVIGKNAMADLLTKRGYTVERVYATVPTVTPEVVPEDTPSSKPADTPVATKPADTPVATKPVERPVEEDSAVEVLAFVDITLSDAQARALGAQIAKLDNVLSVQYISAADALQDLMDAINDTSAFTGLDASAIRARYQITFESTPTDSQLQQLADIQGIVEIGLR